MQPTGQTLKWQSPCRSSAATEALSSKTKINYFEPFFQANESHNLLITLH